MRLLRGAIRECSDMSLPQLRAWLLRRMDKVWRLVPEIRVTEVHVQTFMENLRRLAALRHPSAAAAAAVLRCFIHGLLLPHRFGQPAGPCQLSYECRAEWRIQHVLHGCCWHFPLSGVRGFAAVRHWPSHGLIKFMLSPALSDSSLLLCGWVAKVIHCTCNMLYKRHPAMRNPVVVGAWHVRVRHRHQQSKRCT